MIDLLANKTRRKRITTDVTEDEQAYLNALLEWRKQQGYTNSMAEMIRQMMHFTVTKQYATAKFAMPTKAELTNILNKSSDDKEFEN
ncbi:MAG: hypothetical protein H6553_06720 [Chitinophagales bacterium]|nr:hypothetical protein [Chitinophagales bacterium]